jgi:hypothetical protein
VSCGHLHTVITDIEDNVLSFGANSYGQLGLGQTNIENLAGDFRNRFEPTKIGIKAKRVFCKNTQSMIVGVDGKMSVFGCGSKNRLGTGDHDDRNIPTEIPNIKAQSISCGYTYAIVTLAPTQFGPNVRIIPYLEVIDKLNDGKFTKFKFLSEYQILPHNYGTHIASFYDSDGIIYLVELGYDPINNKIFSPYRVR